MRLIHQAQHAVAVRQLYNAFEVGADAVVGGVVDQDGLGVGILQDGLFHFGKLHPQRDAQTLVAFGVDIDRHRAAQHHRAHHAAVDVAGQDDFLPALCHRQHHRLHSGGGAAHHQKGVRRTEGVGGQLLGFPDDRDRVAQIVQRLHRVDVHAHALFAQQRHQLGVAAAALVAGDVKRDDPHLSEVFQRLIDGRPALIQFHQKITTPS